MNKATGHSFLKMLLISAQKLKRKLSDQVTLFAHGVLPVLSLSSSISAALPS